MPPLSATGSGKEQNVGNQGKCLELDAEAFRFRAAGSVFRCRPEQLLRGKVYARPEKRTYEVRNFTFRKLASTASRLVLEARNREFGFSATLDFTVSDDRLSVRIDPFKLIETRSASFRLLELSLLPGLLETERGEEAEWLLPAYTGALAEPGRLTTDCRTRNRFYMDQSEWEKFNQFNAFCVMTRRGSLLGIVAEGDFSAWCDSEVEDGFCRCFATFRLRHAPDELLSSGPMRIDYRMRAARVPWPELAMQYRSCLVEETGVIPLSERLDGNPVLAYAAEAARIKLFLATKYPTVPDGSSPVRVHATFAEAGKILDALRGRGLEKAIVTLVGWNIDGHDGAYPTRFPVDPRLGGEEGLKALIAKATAMGYQIVVHDNVTDAYLRSPDLDCDMLSTDEYGERQISGIWAGGEAYKLCPAVCLERYGATLDRIHALGFHGCAYLDAQTTGLFRCSHPKHPADEREFALSLCRILEYVRRLYGASSSENCASYALPYCDEAANLGRSGWEQFRSRLDDGFNRLVSRIVPFYNVAVHGLVIYRSCWSSRTGLFGLYENLGNDWFEFEYTPGGLGCDFRDALDDVEASARIRRELPDLAGSFVEEYRENEDGIFIRFTHDITFTFHTKGGTLTITRGSRVIAVINQNRDEK